MVVVVCDGMFVRSRSSNARTTRQRSGYRFILGSGCSAQCHLTLQLSVQVITTCSNDIIPLPTSVPRSPSVDDLQRPSPLLSSVQYKIVRTNHINLLAPQQFSITGRLLFFVAATATRLRPHDILRHERSLLFDSLLLALLAHLHTFFALRDLAFQPYQLREPVFVSCESG